MSPSKKDREELTPEIAREFLETQREELNVRQREIELRENQIEKGHEFSMRSLELQAQDRNDEREYNLKAFGSIKNFGYVLLLAFFILVFGLLYFEKDVLLIEILKVIAYMGVGIFGGYQWGKSKFKNTDSDSAEYADIPPGS